MNRSLFLFTMFFACLFQMASPLQADKEQPLSLAILRLEDRSSNDKEQGKNVGDLLFAGLASMAGIVLVERDDIDKVLAELAMNMTGAVSEDEAVRAGNLLGAKILLTGSVFKTGKATIIVAKLIGTETGKVLGESVKGTDLEAMTEELVIKLHKRLIQSGSELVAKPVVREDRLESLKKKLAGRKLPTASISIPESHVNRQTVDPAAQTEFMFYYRELGGEVLEQQKEGGEPPELRITGEGLSEFAARTGSMVSVKARLEVKIVDKDNKVVAADSQTVIRTDLTEILAGKAALQEAAAKMAERILPKLADTDMQTQPRQRTRNGQ